MSRPRWLTEPVPTLVEFRKDRHPDWQDAVTIIKALQPTLMCVDEVYISEIDKCLFFLALTKKNPAEQDPTKVIWTLHLIEPQEVAPDAAVTSDVKTFQMGDGAVLLSRWQTEDLDAINATLATFLCDYPDGCFSVAGGFPLIIRGERFPDRFVTLNNFKEARQRQVTKFAIMLPRGQKATTTATDKKS